MSKREKSFGGQLKELHEIQAVVREHKTDAEFLFGVIDALPCEPPGMLPSEWAEQNRVIPKGKSVFEGPFKFSNSPWWREVLDRLSPFDPCTHIVVMKPNQIGFTCAVIENAIGYDIACDPKPAAFVTGDERLQEAMMRTRIEPMLEASGLSNKIKPDSTKRRNRRTGDAGGLKEYAGGSLVSCGPNSESRFQGLSFKNLYLDEIDLYPKDLKSSGDTLEVIKKRAISYGSSAKILYGSRPTVDFGIKPPEDGTEESDEENTNPELFGSRILSLYEWGDQRKYFVPCPICGEKQVLEFFKKKNLKGEEYGLMFNSNQCRDGNFDSVRYKCQHCGKEFKEHYKRQITQEGSGAEWRPTAKPKEPYYHSYSLSGMYSYTVSWWELVLEFLKAKGDVGKMQAFYNGHLGEPFRDQSGGVDLRKVSEREGKYRRNEIPDRALFLTAACDVQPSVANPRIECEIKAWGRDWRNWSIDYRVFKGDVKDLCSDPWRQVAALIDERWGEKGLQIERLFIDSSDGNMTSTVYDVCRMYGGGDQMLILPIKGLAVTRKTRHYYRRLDLPHEIFPLIEVYSDNYKNRTANWLRQDWRPGEPAPLGWSEFPIGYPREYYRQLTTEEKKWDRATGMVRWIPHGRNEAWDIFQYNTACADFVIEDYSIFLGLDKPDPEAVWDYFENT